MNVLTKNHLVDLHRCTLEMRIQNLCSDVREGFNSVGCAIRETSAVPGVC